VELWGELLPYQKDQELELDTIGLFLPSSEFRKCSDY